MKFDPANAARSRASEVACEKRTRRLLLTTIFVSAGAGAVFMEALTLWIDGQPEALVLGVLFAAVLLYVVAETAVGDKLIASAKETVSIHSKLNSTPSPEE